jgi:predicted GIY-YIG superfamily endonuclease
MSALRTAIASPFQAAALVGFKSATREALKAVNRTTDFPGCYVFLDVATPIYVGISRTVVKRLTQHLNGGSHYVASLVYRMASTAYPHELKRDQAMKDEQFKVEFVKHQAALRQMRFAFVPITNDLELYIFEAYAAMALDTAQWNTFRTH